MVEFLYFSFWMSNIQMFLRGRMCYILDVTHPNLFSRILINDHFLVLVLFSFQSNSLEECRNNCSLMASKSAKCHCLSFWSQCFLLLTFHLPPSALWSTKILSQLGTWLTSSLAKQTLHCSSQGVAGSTWIVMQRVQRQTHSKMFLNQQNQIEQRWDNCCY